LKEGMTHGASIKDPYGTRFLFLSYAYLRRLSFLEGLVAQDKPGGVNISVTEKGVSYQ
jgi:hypothetical protein